MPTANVCPQCGALLPDTEPGAYCAACLILGVLNDCDSKAPEPVTEKPGEFIGRYKLLEKLGQGGMGTVWMAEQSEPVRRRVALKVIKQGMDSGQVLARFEAERQALALMDHPNIARVLDAGTTSEGRPYFVMELVKGVPLTRFCDEQRLSIRERLNLFVPVCQAIQHAHQKGIIHRDISPSNVLVAQFDGRPVPKVIDFGIAKAIGQPLTERTLVTEFGAVIGKLEYMSPEQAELNQLDIDTRSDIYSLGVLLYELLTGTTPLNRTNLQHAAFDELLRRIREEEPPKPSTRLIESSATLAPTSAKRHADPARLPRLLRGDVDWIVMKAIDKDRERRYETADSFARDILRHLNDEPVLAGPPTTRYRFKKFVRKHRGAVAATAVFVSLLSVAAAVSAGLAIWANRERARAEKATLAQRDAAAEAREVLGFFHRTVLSAPRPKGQQNGLGREITVRAALDAAEPRIAKSFTNRPLVEASIRYVLGDTYYNLGARSNAIVQHERVLELRSKHLGKDHRDTLDTMSALAADYAGSGLYTQAIALGEETLKRKQAILGPLHEDTLMEACNLAVVSRNAGRNEAVLPRLEETFALCKSRLGLTNPGTLSVMNSLGRTYHLAGRISNALPVLQQALELRRSVLPTNHPDTIISLNNFALACQDVGRDNDALVMFKEVVKVSQDSIGPDHPDTLKSMCNLAIAYERTGQRSNAVILYEETLSRMSNNLSLDNPHRLHALNSLAVLYLHQDRTNDALRLASEAFELQKEKLGPAHAQTLNTMNTVAGLYRLAGRRSEALQLLEEGVRLLRANSGPPDTDALSMLNNLGTIYAESHRFNEAIPLVEEYVKLRQQRVSSDDSTLVSTMMSLAMIYTETNRIADAERLLRRVLTVQRKKLPSTSRTMAETIHWLGVCLLRLDKPIEAEPLLRESLDIRQKRLPGDWNTFDTQSFLGAALLAQKHYAEAESLLLQGYEGLSRCEAQIADSLPSRNLTEAAERLVQLYTESKKQEEAAAWRKKIPQSGRDARSQSQP